MSLDNLPAEWKVTSISEILELQEDGKYIHQGWSPQCENYPSNNSEWGVLKTTAIQDGLFIESANKKLPESKEPKIRLEVKQDDLLITNAGPRSRCGVVCHVKQVRPKLMISGKMYRLRFNQKYINTAFTESWLRTSFSQNEINTRKTGINESGLNMTQDRFLTLPVVIAPIREQEQIVKLLEHYSNILKRLKLRFENIFSIINRLRQSILNSVVSGSILDESINIDWSVGTLGDLFEDKPKNGYSPQSVDYVTPYKSLMLTAVTSGKLDTAYYKFVDIDISAESHLFLKKGDILIQRANSIDYVGVSAICNEDIEGFIYPDLMMKVRANNKVKTEYLYYILSSDSVRKYFRKNATGVAGNMPKINQKTVMSAPVKWPRYEIQVDIVKKAELIFSKVNALEKLALKAKEKTDNLMQSIFTKAFRGELTAEWREQHQDLVTGVNSVESLLAKIQAEREASKPVKKVKKVK